MAEARNAWLLSDPCAMECRFSLVVVGFSFWILHTRPGTVNA